TALTGFPVGIALSPLTHRIYVTDAAGNRVYELDDATFAIASTIPLPWGPSLAAMHPGGRLYVAAYQGTGADVLAAILVASAPVVTSVARSDASPTTNEALTATVAATDADNDPLTFAFTWKVNGVVNRTVSGPSRSDTFDLGVAGNGDRGDTVTVDVSASDGTLQSFGGVRATAAVVNAAPTVGVALGTTMPTTGDVITATASGQDPDH